MAEKISPLPEKNARIKEVIDHFADGNVAKFADQLDGVSQQLLNRLFHVNTQSKNHTYPAVSQKVIDAITKALPVSADWLVTGNGDMTREGKSANVLTIIPKKTKKVPLLQDVITTYGEAPEPHAAQQQYIDLGGTFPTATGAMRITGSPMHPTFESGCIVAFQEFDDPENYIPGEAYIVGTRQWKIIRRLKPSGKEGFVKLIADNPEIDSDGEKRYSEFTVQLSKIIFLARVLGKISKNEN